MEYCESNYTYYYPQLDYQIYINRQNVLESAYILGNASAGAIELTTEQQAAQPTLVSLISGAGPNIQAENAAETTKNTDTSATKLALANMNNDKLSYDNAEAALAADSSNTALVAARDAAKLKYDNSLTAYTAAVDKETASKSAYITS